LTIVAGLGDAAPMHPRCARLGPICAALTAVGLVASPVDGAVVLYGLSGPGSGAGTLYRIDTSSGAATPIAGLSGPPVVFPSVGGLEFLGKTLYATGVYAGAANYSFGTIDPRTGTFSAIVTQDDSSWRGLAANTAAGVLYTVADVPYPYTLRSITTAGAITNIGVTGGVEGGGLAYDDVHHILYATGLSRLYTIDTSTGAATLVGEMGFTPDPAGLAYDPELDVLYLNDGGTHRLYQVDPDTGAATLIGANGVSASIDALPEPSLFWLLCSGGALVGVLGQIRSK
jgi:hypothetical protein